MIKGKITFPDGSYRDGTFIDMWSLNGVSCKEYKINKYGDYDILEGEFKAGSLINGKQTSYAQHLNETTFFTFKDGKLTKDSSNTEQGSNGNNNGNSSGSTSNDGTTPKSTPSIANKDIIGDWTGAGATNDIYDIIQFSSDGTYVKAMNYNGEKVAEFGTYTVDGSKILALDKMPQLKGMVQSKGTDGNENYLYKIEITRETIKDKDGNFVDAPTKTTKTYYFLIWYIDFANKYSIDFVDENFKSTKDLSQFFKDK